MNKYVLWSLSRKFLPSGPFEENLKGVSYTKIKAKCLEFKILLILNNGMRT